MYNQQPQPVRPLAYQPPAEAEGNPWATVARVIGIAAAVLACARLGGALSSLLFIWALRSRQTVVGFGTMQSINLAEAILYIPLLIGGIGCAQPRPTTWKLLTYSLIGLLALKALFIATGVLNTMILSRSPFGVLGRLGSAGQTMFNSIEDAVPLLLMLWLLRRRAMRDVFGNPTSPF